MFTYLIRFAPGSWLSSADTLCLAKNCSESAHEVEAPVAVPLPATNNTTTTKHFIFTTLYLQVVIVNICHSRVRVRPRGGNERHTCTFIGALSRTGRGRAAWTPAPARRRRLATPPPATSINHTNKIIHFGFSKRFANYCNSIGTCYSLWQVMSSHLDFKWHRYMN